LPVDPTRCLDDPELAVPVTADDHVVVGARLQHAHLATLELEPGRWHLRFPGSEECDEVVVQFAASDAALVDNEARADATALALPTGRVERLVALPGDRGLQEAP
jgi:hypothetical protein